METLVKADQRKELPITHATSNLGIWLNGKIGFVFVMIWQIRRMGLI